MIPRKILLLANTDWYLYNFRLSLAWAMRAEGWEVVLVSPSGDFGKRLRELGFRWIPFEFSTGDTNPFHQLLVIARLVRLYRRERPGLAHHFTIKCVLYGSIAARLTGGIRVVNAVTGLGHIFTDSKIKARLLRPVVRKAYRALLRGPHQRVIFQNKEDREMFVKWGLTDEASTRHVRGSGVDCRRFQPLHEAPDACRGPTTVLFASRLLREKGIFEFIEAARMIKTRGFDAEFLIAGDIYEDNPSSLSAKDIETIKRESVVSYLGHVDDMPRLLSDIDIVVLPSYREGTPRSLVEAAASGKPIVATDIAGCHGLVQDGVNGFLVPVRDSEALASAIEKLVKDPEQRLRFGTAGREIVLQEFDERIVIRKTLDVYAELLGPDA